MNIIVTGFEPFGGAQSNPSWEAVRLMPEEVEGHRIHRLRLPVVFGQAGDALMEAVRRLRPDLVLLCGVAQGRQAVTPELVAINWRMASLPDNGGQLSNGEKIAPEGPAAYMTELPVQRMVETLEAAGLPARLSLSAGAYVCNDLYYRALAEERAHGYCCAFVHVPGEEVLSAEKAADALTLCLRTALGNG